MAERRRVDIRFQPPWREKAEDGKLSAEYGPKSPVAYARALRNHENWAWRWEGDDARTDAREVITYMRGEDGELRDDVPASELAVYLAIYERGASIREAAKQAGLSRETVRSYLKRLKVRVIAGKAGE